MDMLESLYSQEKVDELREYEAEARGIGIGEKKGAFSTLAKLLSSKKITKSDAADSLGMSVAEFSKMCKELGLTNC